LNPILRKVIDEDPVSTAMGGANLTKLIQNVANNITTIKEGVHPQVALTAPRALEASAKNFTEFVNGIRARGDELLAAAADA